MQMGQDKGNVVALSGFRKDMKFPALSEVKAYWEALRNGRQVPMRSEVDPRGIERALEHAFILERIAPQVARFRLSGMHLTDLMGMEVRGMPTTALFTPTARARAAEAVEEVFARPAVTELVLGAETGFGKPPLEARMLLLPLQSDLGDISRALGCLVAEGHIGRAPRRFDILDVVSSPVAWSGRASAASQATPGLAEDQRPFAVAPTVSRGHLRLVKTDR